MPEWLGPAEGLIRQYGAYGLAVLAALIGLMLGWRVGHRRGHQRQDGEPSQLKKRLNEAERKLLAIRESANSEVLIWTRPRPDDAPLPRRPEEGGKPVVTIANLKGGVGKTTVTSNLATMLDVQFGKRVLAIDMDYQGSMTSMMALATEKQLDRADRNKVINFIEPGHDVDRLRALPIDLGPVLGRTHLVSAYHPLADVENRLLFSWLTHQNTRDVRFSLAEALARFAEDDTFDICVIDAPPRMTTGFINAICASTHLLIPAVMDGLSTEATVYFAEQVQALRPDLFPQLEFLGVLPTMVSRRSGLQPHEEQQKDYLTHQIENRLAIDCDVLGHCAIPRRVEISRLAGEGLIYVSGNAEERAIWEPLGKHVVERLHL
ncbi:MAG: ParA family protein [Pseudomonadota bacterium]